MFFFKLNWIVRLPICALSWSKGLYLIKFAQKHETTNHQIPTTPSVDMFKFTFHPEAPFLRLLLKMSHGIFATIVVSFKFLYQETPSKYFKLWKFLTLSLVYSCAGISGKKATTHVRTSGPRVFGADHRVFLQVPESIAILVTWD